ncbi:MAG: hypothetical protein UZ17_ACD001001912 [Acidobacteria bacterium OLB17]|nr:MAG: hypothetical protein UZ17_ACD001001912 [Acidobacteria bacterium OLB17]MCZ2390205.1 hypothetical protein [Acidobacteriota bacterium]
MKTIFRYSVLSAVFAIFLTAGGISAFAQDACADTATRDALEKTIRENSTIKTQEARKKTIDAGKEFIEKYSSCKDEAGNPISADLVEWLKAKIPVYEKIYRNEEIRLKAVAFEKQFFDGINTKNWNQVYASGKELLAIDPDKYRPAEIVLGSIGLDETAKSPRVNTWNDDTLKYAKMAIADLEAGKKFEPLGFKPFAYNNKEDALGWLNYTIGYILSFDKNDKKQGVGYLYKATQIKSTTNNIAEVYRSIGSFYIDEMNKRIEEMQALVKAQDPAAPDDVKAAKVAEIKAKQGVVNGTAERAINAFAHAIAIASKDPKNAAYTKALTDTAKEIYNIRFGKPDGFDTFLATSGAKDLANPASAVEPVLDADANAETPASTPAKPAASTSSPKPGTAAKASTDGAKSKGTRQ